MSQPTYFTPWRVGLFGVALAIGIVLALTPFRPAEQFPAAGTTADRDIVAGQEATFISAALTTEAQEAARSEVETQFEFNPDIRPAQLEALRLYLDAVVLEREARNAPRRHRTGRWRRLGGRERVGRAGRRNGRASAVGANGARPHPGLETCAARRVVPTRRVRSTVREHSSRIATGLGEPPAGAALCRRPQRGAPQLARSG